MRRAAFGECNRPLERIEDLGGIAYRAPIFATFFAIAMLASVGLPGTSGFIGEFLIILGAIAALLMLRRRDTEVVVPDSAVKPTQMELVNRPATP